MYIIYRMCSNELYRERVSGCYCLHRLIVRLKVRLIAFFTYCGHILLLLLLIINNNNNNNNYYYYYYRVQQHTRVYVPHAALKT